MKFNETIIYLVAFVVLYNLAELLRVKLSVSREPSRSMMTYWTLAIGLFVVSVLFVGVSSYAAYRGFVRIYSNEMAVLGTCFFIIVGAVLLRKVTVVLSQLMRKRKE